MTDTTTDQGDERRALVALVQNKSASAQRGHEEAAAAFVTYEGAAGDLNELSRYVASLEKAIRALSSAQPVAQEAKGIPLEAGIAWQAGAFDTERKAVTVEGHAWYRHDHPRLAAPQPSQGAECSLCQGRGFYGTPGARCEWCKGTGKTIPTPHHPASAEAGKGAPIGWVAQMQTKKDGYVAHRSRIVRGERDAQLIVGQWNLQMPSQFFDYVASPVYASPSESVSDEQLVDLARVASTVNNYSNGQFVSAIFERADGIRFGRAVLALGGSGGES
mgnify:CR=1 FL=1